MHVVDLGRLMLAAYARYEASSDLQDRADADLYRILQVEAIKGRSEAQRQRMEQAIDEGLDYFQTEGERARRMLLAMGIAG